MHGLSSTDRAHSVALGVQFKALQGIPRAQQHMHQLLCQCHPSHPSVSVNSWQTPGGIPERESSITSYEFQIEKASFFTIYSCVTEP